LLYAEVDLVSGLVFLLTLAPALRAVLKKVRKPMPLALFFVSLLVVLLQIINGSEG